MNSKKEPEAKGVSISNGDGAPLAVAGVRKFLRYTQ
ncbi:hypothetical protein CEB3_c18500 [Peptococcaceae bacterium CEB3]|nr:hypothetical protein CEB3_c18500 [Peptococcaceae bacterium CEB3]